MAAQMVVAEQAPRGDAPRTGAQEADAARLVAAPVPLHARRSPSAWLARLRWLLHARSRIEARIVLLQWVVMLLVAAGALMPATLGAGLSAPASALVVGLLALHPLAYLGVAAYFYPRMLRNDELRCAMLSAIDVAVAVGVLFITATKPGYTQVLLFSVVLLTATRYTLGRALAITTLLSILQFFAMIAADHHGLQITNVSSAVVAMFALTFGVNQLSQAERNEAAIAAENARLYHAVLLRNRELASINALSLAAAQDSDPDRMLESGLDLILSSIPVTWGRAFRYERAGQRLELLFVRQAWQRGAARESADDEALRAARMRQMVIRKSEALGGESLARVSAPILVQGATVGVIQALLPVMRNGAGDEPPAHSLAIVCQELGTSVEKVMLRAAAQRALVLEEKNRIARELHDTVLQMLFSMGLGVDWCLQRLADDARIGQKLTEIRRLTAQASNELRSAIYTVSSRVAEVGLVPALEALTADFTTEYGLPVSLSTQGRTPPNLPVLTQNALHRVVRESLMNAYKHAQASHVAVRLVMERGRIVVVIQDDGVGLAAPPLEQLAGSPEHFGLRTLKQQVEDLRGMFSFHTGEEGGTVVRAELPIASSAGETDSDQRTVHEEISSASSAGY